MNTELNSDYWSLRYQEASTGWDIGYASPQLMELAAEFPKDSRILIPGCGRAYEAEALHQLGYTHVVVADWSPEPLEEFAQRIPDFPSSHLVCGDFFELEPAFDLILEQTFYCALPPNRRDDYVKRAHELLVGGGVLAGLLFDFPLTAEGPPFGGSEAEYRERFAPYFELQRLERADKSIPPRAGRELVFRFMKKSSGDKL